MSSTTKKIQLAEQLTDIVLDNLTEQHFSPSVGIAKVKGDANVGWTTCFERRCNRITDKYEKRICRETCKRDEASRALNRVRGLKTYCNQAKNPNTCLNSLGRAEDAWNDKITRIDDRISAAKRQRDEHRARATGR